MKLSALEEKLANSEFEKALMQSEVQDLAMKLSKSSFELSSSQSEAELMKRRLHALRSTERECTKLKKELTELRVKVDSGREVISGTVMVVDNSFDQSQSGFEHFQVIEIPRTCRTVRHIVH